VALSDINVDQVARLTDEVHRVLGERVLGTFMHGSTGLGQLRPNSDLDLLVVTHEPLSDSQRQRLTAVLLSLSGSWGSRPPALRPVELTVAVQGDICPWRFPPRRDYLFGEWLRARCVAGLLPPPSMSADLTIALFSALACDAPVGGVGPHALLDPIPTEHLVRASLDGIEGLLLDLRTDTTNVLLTLARVWRTAAHRDVLPKDGAATWAASLLPRAERNALLYARTCHLRPPTVEDWARYADGSASAASHMAQIALEVAKEMDGTADQQRG
jgi:streptomycin 3"-adenylyltransferase